jgi:hypothetical protein
VSRGGDTRFRKGQSGNPAGRPKARRSRVTAFEVIFDKTLTVTQNGVERELTIEEALQLQTLQAALGGNRMATRQVLKMIEKREAALTRRNPAPPSPIRLDREYDSDNAREAMRILGIADHEDTVGAEPDKQRMKLTTWAVQAALSRPGRKKLTEKDVDSIRRFTFDADLLKWPRGRVA